MSGSDPERVSPDASTAGALAGLAEGFVRDWVTNGTILLSLITAVAGMTTAMPWIVVAPVVGAVGVVVGFLSIAKRWPVGRTWAALAVVLAADVALLVAMFA